MVILGSPKLIYIHIHKTGGETIERSLAQIQQSNDLILDEKNPRVSEETERLSKLDKHSSALEVADALGMYIWNTYFSWSTVRNPYGRMASLYSYFAAITEPELAIIGFPLDDAPEVQRSWIESPDYSMTDQWAFAGVRAYLLTRGSQTPFSDFLRHPLLINDEPAYLSQFSRLGHVEQDALLVNRTVKLEHLSQLWPQLCTDMGLPPLPLLIQNETPRRWRRRAADLFASSADVELANTIFADDFRWFDYEMIGRDPVPRIYPVAVPEEHARC
jgi:hypothetical protein